jgi:ABC-type nitrate/sulfonate/bicarbonate transport system substrate-binding protein
MFRMKEPLRVGFLPVSDCAPLVVAHETGLFAKYDIEVELVRETSWASIRDKVIEGELDAAHAPAALPFLANLGVESDPCACISGLVLSLQGNAITVSRPLWDDGVRDAQSLRESIYKSWSKRTYTFAVAFPYSSPYFLLRQWLKSVGIVPGIEVRIVVVPPAQMFPTLKLGYIDGFCAGEPWTSVAVQAAAGVCVATSADLAPLHPDKVLMARLSFATGRAEEHDRLLAALLEACAFCDLPENRPLIGDILAHPQYVNAPADCLSPGSIGPFGPGSRFVQTGLALNIFHRHYANDPSDDKALWIMSHLYEFVADGVFKNQSAGRTPALKNIFRRDLYTQAAKLAAGHGQGVSFEAATIAAAGVGALIPL